MYIFSFAAAALKPHPSFISPSALPVPPGSSLAGSVTFTPITSSSPDLCPPHSKVRSLNKVALFRSPNRSGLVHCAIAVLSAALSN